MSRNTGPKAQSTCSWCVCTGRGVGGALSQKHFISMVIKVPVTLKNSKGQTPTLTFSCLHAAMLLCLSLYMVDLQSGSLWWHNQFPAELAFRSSPKAFCPLDLTLHLHALIVCIYNVLRPSIFSPSTFYFSYVSSVVRSKIMYQSLMLWQQLPMQRKRVTEWCK